MAWSNYCTLVLAVSFLGGSLLRGQSGIAVCSALTFDTEYKVDPALWSQTNTEIWEQVVDRMGGMVQVKSGYDEYADTQVLPPLGQVCGPQQTETLSPRHIDPNTGYLVLPNPSSMLVYLYTDRTTLLCSDPDYGIVAYAWT